jgi:hypothetical protein
MPRKSSPIATFSELHLERVRVEVAVFYIATNLLSRLDPSIRVAWDVDLSQAIARADKSMFAELRIWLILVLENMRQANPESQWEIFDVRE